MAPRAKAVAEPVEKPAPPPTPISEPAAVQPEQPRLRAFYAIGVDGFIHNGVQYDSHDGIMLLPALEGWYSPYIEMGWLKEKLD